MFMRTKEDLINEIKKYNPDLSFDEEDKIKLAYDFARKKHSGQVRASGEEYFTHPLAVAFVAVEYKLDPASIITALLHDTVEDTDTTLTEIKELFGETVASLVEGLTKLSSIEITSKEVLQAENYRKFIISISKDIRVLIIKLFDRYHNISTLSAFNKIEKRKRIALETLNIYVPLAERMGMEKLQSFMSDICFKELYPQEYYFITDKLETLKEGGTNLIDPIIDELSTLMTKYKMNVQIYGREKTPYSIWKKITNKNLTFDEIFDIIAFRFITDNVENCYKLLGILHSNYHVISNRFKDYISTPKPNNYQAIHTTVIGPMKKRIEVQIQTEKMEHTAQYGCAAHWIYKNSTYNPSSNCDWLRNMVNAITHVSSSEEILENTKLPTFIDSIFCFTPMGDLWDMPINSTVLDFAYRVHSNVGNHCTGAKINKVVKNIKTLLQNGDMVEILTSENQKPSPEWKNFVVTTRAKKAIKHYFYKNKKIANIQNGKALLTHLFELHNIPFDENKLATILNIYGASYLDELYLLVGLDEYSPEDILLSLYPDIKIKNIQNKEEVRNTFDKTKIDFNLSDKNINNIPIHFAKCCNPVPDNKIVGIIHKGKGITIHRNDCSTLKKYEDSPDKLFSLKWDDYNKVKSLSFKTKLSVLSKNIPGALNEITSVFVKENIDLDNVRVLNKTEEFVDLLFTINIQNPKQLNDIILKMKNIKIINTVIKCNK